MPRYRRLFIRDVPLHVVQRGHDRSPVFLCEQDYQYYLENIRDAREILDIEVFAYCLMTNHVHLLLMPTERVEDVSAFMRILAGRQTRYLNSRERRSGTLWEGRFKSSLIDSETYLMACYRYVELNPVKARMVTVPENYPWSSYRQNAGLVDDTWVNQHPVFSSLGDTPASRSSAYRKLVRTGISDGDESLIRRALRRNQVTGDESFRASIADMTGREVSSKPPGRPPKSRC